MRMAQLWILMYFVFLVSKRLSASNDECLRSKQFKKGGKGFALTGYYIASLQVSDLFDCSFACLQKSRCQSYNFREVPNSLHLCQLSYESKDTKPGNYQQQAGMTYYDIIKPQKGPGCSSSPCLNGGNCISTCHRVPFSFRCVCNEHRSGDFCQNMKDGYDLTFPTKSIFNVVNSTALKHNLTALTLSIWFQTSQAGSFALVAGLLAIVCRDDGKCALFVKGEKRTFYGAPLNDGMWHSLCVTWAAVGGMWSAYVDGKTNVRRRGNDLRTNHVVNLNGEQLVLGQEIKDGALREGPSFIGNISRVNMWDYVLSMEDVNRMSTNCSSPAGNVVKWRDFRNGLQGRVVLTESSQCVSADFSVNVSLKFPSATNVDRVRYLHAIPSLQAFTVCLWIKVTAGVLFSSLISYADSSLNKKIYISLRGQGVWIHINGNYRRAFNTPFLEMRWHHVCITWTNDGGELKCFVDGSIKRTHTSFKNEAVINSGGVLIFGQRQATVGGSFDQTRCLVGFMSHVNMWNSVLSIFSLAEMATGFGTEKGNVIAWGQVIRSPMYGAVEVVPIKEDPPKRTMSDFMFFFPSRSVNNYVELTSATTGPSIALVTVSMWVKIAQSANMVLFSYKTLQQPNSLTMIASNTKFQIVINGLWRTVHFSGFTLQDGWQHVCFVWGHVNGNWKLFVNGVSAISASNYAVGEVIPSGGKIVLGLRHFDHNTYQSDQSFIGEISHLNIWNKKLDAFSGVIPAMYSGCDAIGGNWLNWASLSQATLRGNVTMVTPAKCVLPDETAADERNNFCQRETLEGCTAPVYALFGGKSGSRSKRWRCYFTEAVKVNSRGQLQYDTAKNSACYITITSSAFFDII